MCWLVAGGDALRYELLALGTDILVVFSAFLSWANWNGHGVITQWEMASRLAAARALMGTPPKY